MYGGNLYTGSSSQFAVSRARRSRNAALSPVKSLQAQLFDQVKVNLQIKSLLDIAHEIPFVAGNSLATRKSKVRTTKVGAL